MLNGSVPKRVCRILIADDHAALRRGIRGLLEANEAWKVVAEASDGNEALHLAEQTKPDVAILDYSMPELNGAALTRAIKKKLPGTEILIYTMHNRETVLAEALQAGARAYVLKSDPVGKLLDAVAALSMHQPFFSSTVSETLLHHFLAGERSPQRDSVLTPQERKIVTMVAEGMINKQIAHILGISVKTVETHRSTVMHKLHLRTTAELVLYAIRNDFIRH